MYLDRSLFQHYNTDLLLQADLFEEYWTAPHFSRNAHVFLDKIFLNTGLAEKNL
jgi:hypothetical protein